MTEIDFDETNLKVKVLGADKLWALKSELTIPLRHVSGAYYDPEIAKTWYHGLKLPGSSIPGVLTAGTFYKSGKKMFWDVHNPDKTIVIELVDESYNQLVIEVQDPYLEIGRITSTINSITS